jgi:glycosyltransferase involved in cell wall biosynthesis
MLRVLTLSTLFPNGAAPTFGIFVERQTQALARRPDVQVRVVAPIGLPPWPLTLHPHYAARAALAAREQWNGLTVYRPRFPLLPGFGQHRHARSIARGLLPLLREIRTDFAFDVIDTEFFWPDGPAAMHLAAALGVPFSIKARGSDISQWSLRPTILPQLLEAAHAAGGLLAVSGALRAHMAALGMPEDRIAVHYTGVDLDRFAPTERGTAKARLGVSGPLIVTVGTLSERKGQRIAIDALTRIPEATLILVGEGPARRAFERHAAALGLSDRVRLPGNRPPEEVAALLAAADVMMLPSESEGLANVWVEAMACGTPVVTPNIGGAREAVTADAGRVVAREPESFAAAARALIADPPDPWTVRKAAERFSWEANAAQLDEHLRRIVELNPVQTEPG